MKTILQVILALGLAVAGFGALAQTAVPAYNPYPSAPFSVDAKSGLAADLVAYLNTKLKGKYVFDLQTLPRERLSQEVISSPDFKGIVLFLSPPFVGDADKKKFAWSNAILADKNEVISSLGKKVEYKGPDSLKGTQFAAVRGNKYVGLDDLFGKDIKRNDVNSELQILKLVANERADVTVMGSSLYNYLMKTSGSAEGLTGKLHVSATPHLKYDRFIFSANSDAALAKELAAVTAGMAGDPAWKAILSKYGVN